MERENKTFLLKLKLETREQRLTPIGGGTALLDQLTWSDSLVAKRWGSTPLAINDGWPYHHCHKLVPAFHVSTYHGLLNSNSSRRWNKAKSILSGPSSRRRSAPNSFSDTPLTSTGGNKTRSAQTVMSPGYMKTETRTRENPTESGPEFPQPSEAKTTNRSTVCTGTRVMRDLDDFHVGVKFEDESRNTFLMKLRRRKSHHHLHCAMGTSRRRSPHRSNSLAVARSTQAVLVL